MIKRTFSEMCVKARNGFIGYAVNSKIRSPIEQTLTPAQFQIYERMFNGLVNNTRHWIEQELRTRTE